MKGEELEAAKGVTAVAADTVTVNLVMGQRIAEVELVAEEGADFAPSSSRQRNTYQ